MTDSATNHDPASLELSPDTMQAMADQVLQRVLAHLAALPEAPGCGDYDGIEALCRAMREMTSSDLSTYAANGLAAAPLFNLEQTVSEWENMFNAVKS